MSTDKHNSPLSLLDNQFIHPWEDFSALGTNNRTILDKADGIYVYDTEGNRLMDAPAGMWCVNIGHRREEMAQAIADQTMALSYNSPWSLSNGPAARLAAKLGTLSPGDLNHVFFTTGGSTAVDTALRFVAYRNNVLGRPNKKKILSRTNAYHGSTYLASSHSGKAGDKKCLDLDTRNVELLRDPNPVKRPEGMSESAFADLLITEFQQTVDRLGADAIAAFIAEPVLASGGVVVPPDDYLSRCAEICRDNDILVIADEVVTAFGRLGHFFASESVFGVVPDIITTAKGLTSGYLPLGAVLMSDALLEELSEIVPEDALFANGYTYSGHPVSCAAALKNIEIMERENLFEHVRTISPYFQQQLQTLAENPLVDNVRGAGLMGCVECRKDIEVPKGEQPVAQRVDERCQALGLIVRPIYNMCVMSPPLIITREQIDEMFGMLAEGLELVACEVL